MQSAENLSIIVALSGGILSILSPCVLPLVPAYISYISGISFDDLKSPLLKRRHRPKVILSALCFILGLSTVFVILGASFSFLGRFVSSQQGIIQKIAGLVIIFFGLSIAGVFKIPILMRSREFLPLKAGITGYIGSMIIGISFGAAWTPCIGPILGSILALAAGAKGMSQGVTLLTAYSLGFAIPFLFAAWASGSVLSILQKYEKVLKGIHIAGGIFLVFIGILVMTGYFTVLNSLFIKLTPAWLLEKI
ncbi:MAG: sulfite exporter TauE/SafE family protein [Desulfobacterales bacterium]|nr:MAG: sulfite exporter TauE/SafE family protein [Desulfobacterales bacterium]